MLSQFALVCNIYQKYYFFAIKVVMYQESLFHILNEIDSTNNYAMAKVHEGLAHHGMAWFAASQSEGKGQRGKKWTSNYGENIILSIVIEPLRCFASHPFLFNAHIANTCRQYLADLINEEVKIKWPNDIYIRDRKAGGLLIENIYRGKQWYISVAGIGINVNQLSFSPDIPNPISLKQITDIKYDTLLLSKKLHLLIIENMLVVDENKTNKIIIEYNYNLYKRNESVRLRRENMVFETKIESVNEFGQLLTSDTIDRQFEFGEIEWVM